MASWLIYSIQSLSLKLLDATRGSQEDSHQTEPIEVAVEVREPATVMEAAQAFDLQTLPTPEELEWLDRQSATQISYNTPLGVADLVEMYRTALTTADWIEESDQTQITAEYATLLFTKTNFLLSLSLTGSGGETMVQIINHGNIDLRALPQMVDAEVIAAFPQILIYVSPIGVAEVADFTRQELTAQGWAEYTRPNTAMADDPDHRLLTFIQNGLTLSA